MIEEEWSGIDATLKRRSNLIPNLIEVVQGYSKHETKTLEELTDRRMGSSDIGTRGEQESQISKSLGSLIAVAEAYPDLKASHNFSVLQHSLSEVEMEIQQARIKYNRAVRRYNTHVQSFPSNLMASIFTFQEAAYFTLELSTQRDMPSVEF